MARTPKPKTVALDEDGNPVNPLSRRLPREDNHPVVPFNDPPPLMEIAQAVLGPRMKETRMGFTLDGKLCNVRDILRAANLKYADE